MDAYRKIPKISLGAYIFPRPFLRGLFLEGFIYGGKFSFHSRLGLYWEGNLRPKIDWKEIYVSSLQKVFTETRLKDVELTKTQPCQYFVYMERGNLNQEFIWHT